MKDESKKDFVNTCLLINKAKKTAKEADLYVRKINEQVLPRFRSADITSNIGQRNVDIPLQISLSPLSSFKEQLSFKGINTNNEKPKTVTKPKSPYQEKLTENAYNENNSQQLRSSSEPLKSLQDYANNVGIVNLIANGDCNINNLTVQKNPSVNVKSDLVIQKVTNIQIKPDSKKTLSNKNKPNVAYHEVTFDVQPEICTSQSPLPKNNKNNTVIRYEIRRILCGMLDDILSNSDSLSDPLVHKLQKIMINLEETDLMKNKDSNEVENLIEEHSIYGFSETLIKNRLLKIAENYCDDKSFEQMAEEMENFYRQIDNRLTNIKNLYLASNPLMAFPVILGDNIPAGVANSIYEKPGNNCLNDTYQQKNFHDSNTISVKDFLYLTSNNFASSKMPDKISNLGESGSEVKTSGCKSPEDMIRGESYNSLNINTVSIRKNTNEIPLLKSQLTEFEDKNCLTNINSDEHTLINNRIQDSENFQLKKQKCHLNSEFSKSSPTNNTEYTDIACTDHLYQETGDSFTSMTTEEIKSGTENSIRFEVADRTCGLHNVGSKSSIGDIFNFSKNNSDVEQTLMNNQIFPSIKQECHINSILSKSPPSNNNLEYTDNAYTNHLYKETGDSSTSTMSSKQTIQEIESGTESSINFEVGDHIYGLHKVDSNTSIGEIFL